MKSMSLKCIFFSFCKILDIILKKRKGYISLPIKFFFFFFIMDHICRFHRGNNFQIGSNLLKKKSGHYSSFLFVCDFMHYSINNNTCKYTDYIWSVRELHIFFTIYHKNGNKILFFFYPLETKHFLNERLFSLITLSVLAKSCNYLISVLFLHKYFLLLVLKPIWNLFEYFKVFQVNKKILLSPVSKFLMHKASYNV